MTPKTYLLIEAEEIKRLEKLYPAAWLALEKIKSTQVEEVDAEAAYDEWLYSPYDPLFSDILKSNGYKLIRVLDSK